MKYIENAMKRGFCSGGPAHDKTEMFWNFAPLWDGGILAA